MTADELRLWTGFLDSGRILETLLEQQLNDQQGMTHREYEVLVRLDGVGGAMRMSELARQIEASAPLVTQTVERLESRDWVRREPDDADGRGVRAGLQPAGRKALATAAGPHAELIRTVLLDRVGDSRLAVVADALADVADHLRSHRRHHGCDDPDCPLA